MDGRIQMSVVVEMPAEVEIQAVRKDERMARSRLPHWWTAVCRWTGSESVSSEVKAYWWTQAAVVVHLFQQRRPQRARHSWNGKV